MFAFVAGLTLGFLPLFLFLLNHLTISPPLFPLNPSLTFCNPQTHLPDAKIGVLDTVVFILYPIEACLGLPTVVVMGKAFHWRKSTIALCASGLLLAVVLDLFCYFYFLFPLSWSQCFHLVGER
jgi:O-antigen ligase